jgi:hypothetical protein
MDGTETFLSLFNELEQFLREETNSKRDVPFGGLVGRASRDMPAVHEYARDLREWADLRNAIVHEHPRGHVIAEITAEALSEFEAMMKKIIAPELVYPRFQREVRVFSEDDSLMDAVKDLWNSGHSQVILRVDGMLTLLGYAGIIRWLGSAVDGTRIDLADASVGDALTFEEEGGIAFLPGDATVFDARQLFLNFPERFEQRLRAIVITEHGKATEEPLGIITASDLVAFDG